MNNLRFVDPWLLIFLLVVPLIIFYQLKYSVSGKFKFSSINTLKKINTSKSLFYRNILLVLRSLCIIFLIFALARPQSGKTDTIIRTEGIDIILAIDTSGSMQALDFTIDNKRVNRLDVVKNVVRDFIKKRTNDRIGMVVFAANAFTQCPLTLDHGILLNFLDRVKIGMVGDGTAIGSGLGISVSRLKDIKSKSKVVILLTDGRNNTGEITPDTAAELAKTYNIKVYTIGVGTKGPVPFLVDTFFGKEYVYQNVDIDEDTLQKIAFKTGGEYFRATDTQSLKNIYDTIDKLEKTEVKEKKYMEYKELFPYFLIPGLLCLLIEIVLGNTRFRKIP